METSKGGRDELADAVSSAAQHHKERKAATEAASEKQKPKSRVGLLVLALVVLAGIALLDWYLLTRPPETLPVAEQEVDLNWFILSAVELVESRRTEEGTLPTAAELEGALDEVVTYVVRGGNYTLIAESNGVTVEYNSELPVEEWISARNLSSAGGVR